jgi:hypothetical protein
MLMNRNLRAARRAVRHIVRRRIEAVADALKAIVSPRRSRITACASLTSNATPCMASLAERHRGS